MYSRSLKKQLDFRREWSTENESLVSLGESAASYRARERPGELTRKSWLQQTGEQGTKDADADTRDTVRRQKEVAFWPQFVN